MPTQKQQQLDINSIDDTLESIEEILAETPEQTEDSQSSAAFTPERVNPKNYVSSGLTLLNLATTNDPECFIEKGTYDLLVGQSGAGKSFLATQILAEAANNPNFEDYTLIYDDVEHGCLFDIRQMFGNKLADRMRPPRLDESGMPQCSSSVEDFFAFVDEWQQTKKPFIYILDSMDSLTSSQSDVKFDENNEQRRKDLASGKTTSVLTQGYGDGKAKYISGNLRRVVNRLPETGSILIIISQVRDNITGYGAKYVRSGGQALKFYAHEEFWLYVNKPLSRTVDKKERNYGTLSRIELVKNRITGIKSSVEFPVLVGAGISNVDSCLDWLCEEGKVIRPARSNGVYEVPDLGIKLKREALLRKMEDDFSIFQDLISKTWYDILNTISSKRKRKYE